MQRQVWKENIRVNKRDDGKKEKRSFEIGSYPFDAEDMLLRRELLNFEEPKAKSEGR